MEPNDSKLPQTPSLYHHLHGTVQWDLRHCDLPNHFPSLVCVEHINCVLTVFHGGGSWSTSVRQIGDVPVAKSEVFHQILHAAGTHEGITIDMTKLNKDTVQQNCSL
jgi:hypothetical protein